MSFSNHGRFRQQVRFLRRQFLQDGDLPFTDVLSESAITQALKALDVVWLDRIYSPLVTLWVFLGQVLSQDHSCRAAVARLIAHRVSRGQRPCSAETGAYCRHSDTHAPRRTASAMVSFKFSSQLKSSIRCDIHSRAVAATTICARIRTLSVCLADRPENLRSYGINCFRS